MIRYGALLLLAIVLFSPLGRSSGAYGLKISVDPLAFIELVGDGLIVLPTPTEIHRPPGVGYVGGKDSPNLRGGSRSDRHRS